MSAESIKGAEKIKLEIIATDTTEAIQVQDLVEVLYGIQAAYESGMDEANAPLKLESISFNSPLKFLLAGTLAGLVAVIAMCRPVIKAEDVEVRPDNVKIKKIEVKFDSLLEVIRDLRGRDDREQESDCDDEPSPF